MIIADSARAISCATASGSTDVKAYAHAGMYYIVIVYVRDEHGALTKERAPSWHFRKWAYPTQRALTYASSNTGDEHGTTFGTALNGSTPTCLPMRNHSDGTRDFPCYEGNSTTPSWPKHSGMTHTHRLHGGFSCATLSSTLWGHRKRGRNRHESTTPSHNRQL